jgi:hypothetical protein
VDYFHHMFSIPFIIAIRMPRIIISIITITPFHLPAVVMNRYSHTITITVQKFANIGLSYIETSIVRVK